MNRRGEKQEADSPWFACAGVLVTLLNVLGCADLLVAWRRSPMDFLGWTALLIWLTPLLWFAAKENPQLRLDVRRMTVFIVSLSIGAFGALTSLNVLQHIGLTVALVGWLGGLRWPVLIWSLCAISWMPAFGWAATKLFPAELALAVRIVTASVGAAVLVRFRGAEFTLLRPSRTVAWAVLAILLTASVVWQFVPLSGAEWRLMQMPVRGIGYDSQGAALSPAEVKSLGAAIALRRLYHFDDQRVVATVIDATQNRHAVHDPLYCFTGSGWQTVDDQAVNVRGGAARHVVFSRRGNRTELLFWFSDGKTRHASISRYWWQTTLRRLTLGASGNEPVLVLLQSYDAQPLDWNGILGEHTPFFRL